MLGKYNVSKKSPRKASPRKSPVRDVLYCLHCRTRRYPAKGSLQSMIIKNPKVKQGVNALTGKCAVCGTKMIKFISLPNCLNNKQSYGY